MDLNEYAGELIRPDAAALIETFRAIGYNLPTALADLIDNSISAGAGNIWIEYDWKGADTWLSVRDDGVGMGKEDLLNAMKPGSLSPAETRKKTDLGRFGLGLKTASFSQCRRLTVISSTEQEPVQYRSWDLDFVVEKGDWHLLEYLSDDIHLGAFDSMLKGTTVLWEKLDRMVNGFVKNDKKHLDKFLQMMEQVERHLAMVFHRFLETGRLRIFIHNQSIEPWDPFLKGESDTRLTGEELISAGENIVKVSPFILPHKSKLETQAFERASGLKGWNAQQGFYIYRGERLLVAGDWLGMFQQEEHFKLARIQVDLSNSLDMDWQIDIKKSVARPPLSIRKRLRSIAKNTRMQAAEVYRHRGKRIDAYQLRDLIPLWTKMQRNGKIRYQINRDHPLVSAVKTGSNNKGQLASLLRLLEETIPIATITLAESETPQSHTEPFENTTESSVREVAVQLIKAMIEQGDSFEIARKKLYRLPPFNKYPQIIETIQI